MSQNEILASLEKATGGEKWKTTPASADALHKESLEKLNNGDFSALFGVIVGTIYSGDELLDYAKLQGLDNDLLGLPKEKSLDETIAEIVKEVE